MYTSLRTRKQAVNKIVADVDPVAPVGRLIATRRDLQASERLSNISSRSMYTLKNKSEGFKKNRGCTSDMIDNDTIFQLKRYLPFRYGEAVQHRKVGISSTLGA